MIMIRTLLTLAAGIGVGVAVAFAADHDHHKAVKVTQLSQRDIVEKLDGKAASATVVEVTFEPGQKDSSSRPGACTACRRTRPRRATRASWQWSWTRGTPGRSRFQSRRSNPPGESTHVQPVSSWLARGLAASRGSGLLVPLRGCRSLRPVGPIWRRRGGMGRLSTIYRLHRPTLVV